ncbi:hypothetical protein Tco_0941752 [Tanacetum coccineum]|uniref:Uncharacterized protein n=1 Tax=Tanacetum coccineum TaxID=301880 RepID=A0ABQ5DSJ6_9ASTR
MYAHASSTVTSELGISVCTIRPQAWINPGKAHEALGWVDTIRPDPRAACKKNQHGSVTTPPITTEATSITTTLPEITPFIALQLRVEKLEQDMSEVKKTDHSAAALASIKSQVPTVVDKYLGTKLDDALLRILERHTADLIEKYFVLPGPESIKNQESKKSPKEIIKIKREQAGNADEDAMDKEVKDRVKDHKRKHDSDDDEDDDDDDEGPSAGSNQGKSTKRRRHDSGASGSAQPPPKDDEQSSKKPTILDALLPYQSTTTLTSTGWQITDTRDVVIDSSMHRSEPESGHSEHSSDDVSKQDEGHVSIFWRTLITLIFPSKKLRNAEFVSLAFNLVKAFHKNNVFLQFQMDECHKLLTNNVDLVNPEGYQILRNIDEPLPLGGPPGQVTIQPQFFFNKDLEYLLTGDKEQKTPAYP